MVYVDCFVFVCIWFVYINFVYVCLGCIDCDFSVILRFCVVCLGLLGCYVCYDTLVVVFSVCI